MISSRLPTYCGACEGLGNALQGHDVGGHPVPSSVVCDVCDGTGQRGTHPLGVVLGAPDPEMEAIEKMAREVGVTVYYAADDNRARVTPGTAYKATKAVLAPGQEVCGNCGTSGETVLVADHCPGCGASSKALRTAHGPLDLIQVECAPVDRWWGTPGDSMSIARCDHHNPKDPGFGQPSENAVAASSLGQFISVLAQRIAVPVSWSCLLPTEVVPLDPDEEDKPGDILRVAPGVPVQSSYAVCLTHGCYRLIPVELTLIAACDHALGAAYAGKVPGIDPEMVRGHRRDQKAQWLSTGGAPETERVAVAAVLLGAPPRALDNGWVIDPTAAQEAEDNRGEDGIDRDPVARFARWRMAVDLAMGSTAKVVQAASKIVLRPAVDPGCDHHHPAPVPECPWCSSPYQPAVEVIDLRAVGTLPLLPDVCCELGVAVLYRMVPDLGARDPRVKIGITGAGDGTGPGRAPVEAFLGGWAAEQGLVAPYGDAARGFAGAYEVAP